MRFFGKKSAALRILPLIIGSVLVVLLFATMQMRIAIGITPTIIQYLIPAFVGLLAGTIIGFGYFRIRSSEDELEQFFTLSVDLLSITDGEGKFLRLNPAFPKLLGWLPGDMVSKPFTAFIHPDDKKNTIAELAKLDQGASIVQFENRYRCKDGGYRWLHWTAHATSDGLLYSVAHDVTARKQIESSLRNSSERLKAIVDTAVDGIITIDEKGIIETINPAAEQIFGYQQSELIGKNVKVLMPAPYQDEHNGYVKKYIRTGEKQIIGIGRQVEGLRKDGTIFPMELAVGESKVSGQHMFTGIVRDITQQIEQEEVLRQSEARNRALLDVIPDAIMRIHRDGTTLDRKLPTNYQSIGSMDSAVGKKQDEILPPSLARQAMASITKALDTNELELLEYEAEIQGITYIREARIIPSDKDEAIVMIRDITEQRAMEEAKQSAIIAERDRIARDLHDSVTQTLFSASLIADVLPTMWDRNPERAKVRLEELRELARGALAEMRTLLLELRPTVLIEAELDELLQQLVVALIGRARVKAELVVNGDLSNLTDEMHVAIYRTVQEALNNVAKHANASHVTVSLNQHDSQLHISIQDDGSGFDPFAIKGGHFGLQNMYERITAVGGTLAINSDLGQGTNVLIQVQTPHTAITTRQ